MSILRTVVFHELRRLRRERAGYGLLIVFALMCAYAALNGRAWTLQRQSTIHAIASEQSRKQQEYFERVSKSLAQTRQQPTVTFLAIGVEHYPTLPVSPLAPLALGQAEGYPYETHFHALSKATALIDSEPDRLAHPATLLIGRFDLAFVGVFLLPLMLLAATFDLWTGERDRGTSSLLLSQPVRPATLVAGKLLARGGVTLIALVSLFEVALLAAAPSRAIPLAEWGLLTLALGLYGAIWLLVALAANLLTRRTVEAVLACGTLWLAPVVLIPALLDASADSLHPSPSRAELVNTIRLLDQEQKDIPRTLTPVTAAYSCPAPGHDRTAAARLSVANVETDERALAEPVFRFEAKQAQRRDFMDRIRWLSPAVVLEDSLERIAGTDAARALAFQRQAQEFLTDWRALVVSSSYVQIEASAQDIWNALPRFAFHEPAPRERHAPIWWNFITLALYGVALLILVSIALRQRILFNHEQDGAR